MNDAIMTIRDVAQVLKLAEKTVYAMATEGELPAFKVRGQWLLQLLDPRDQLLEHRLEDDDPHVRLCEVRRCRHIEVRSHTRSPVDPRGCPRLLGDILNA